MLGTDDGEFFGGLENSRSTMRPSGRAAIKKAVRVNEATKLLMPSGLKSSTDALGLGFGADDVLHRLREQSSDVDSRTYVKLFQRCMELRNVSLGKQVRDHILQSGRALNIYELNTLIKLHAVCGSVEDARRVFDTIVDKTVVSWNAMIAGYAQRDHAKEAVTLFRQMLDERLEANTITYLTVLDACSRAAALQWGKEVHDHAKNAGLLSDFRVGTALVNMYVKGGSMEDARQVFLELHNRDVSAFNVIIGGYAKNGDGEKAFETFLTMQQEGIKPNRISYLSILEACSGPKGLAWGKTIHAQCVKAGVLQDIRIATALIRMYTNCGSVKDAREVFDRMVVRDVVCWTVMIEGYAESGHVEDAFGVFSMMQEDGIQPDKVTYMHILNACASSGNVEYGREAHFQVEKAGYETDLLVSTALVHMYSKCGAVRDARLVFDKMVSRDVVSWSAMIGGYAENGRGKEALEIFQQMKLAGVEPDRVTYINMLNVCVNPGELDLGKEIHSLAVKAGLVSHIPLGNALINMYSKCGSAEDARQVFDAMSKRDVITWNAMIGGYAQHGYAREALELFERMLKERIKPNVVTFVGVLTACSRAGFVTEGRHFLASLVQDHGIVPTVELYGCMADLLGRAGLLDETEQFINGMPLEAPASIWSSLLGACRIHGNLEIAERAAERILSIDPHDSAVYVQLSHMYAAAGMWENVAKVRKVMEDRGVKKEQGCTSIHVDGKGHTFVTEDRSHPQVNEIYTELARLMVEIKRAGYVPFTENVLHDVGEQQKEEAVSYHSEKLAIAYGILSTPPSAPIHIYKNLRVCADCHSASKFISKLAGREIIARDASRFHHFKNGVCSCGDYW